MKKNYKDFAKKVVDLVGGESNVTYFTHCITRLRFNVKDEGSVNLEELKKIKGSLGAQWSGDQLQVIIGPNVDDVFDAICEISSLGSTLEIQQEPDNKNKKITINTLFETLSACMVPVLPALCGVGLIKGILVLMNSYMNVSTNHSIYVLLNVIADTGFYFLPLIVAYTASIKFKVNSVIAVMMMGILIHPTVTSMVGTGFNLLGWNIPVLNYSSTIFPSIISVWVLSYVYKFIEKLLPSSLRFVLTPGIALIIMAPICLGIIGPIGYYIGYYLATFVSSIFYFNPFVGGFVLGALRPFILLTGMQTTFTPIILNNLSTLGYDFIWPVHSIFSMACCGIAIGSFLKAKRLSGEIAEEKEVFISSFVSGFAGISEPALYGIAFRFKSQLVALICSSAIVGSLVSGFGAKVYAAGNPPWLFLPGFGETMVLMAIGFVGVFVLALVLSYLAGFTNELKFGKDKK